MNCVKFYAASALLLIAGCSSSAPNTGLGTNQGPGGNGTGTSEETSSSGSSGSSTAGNGSSGGNGSTAGAGSSGGAQGTASSGGGSSSGTKPAGGSSSSSGGTAPAQGEGGITTTDGGPPDDPDIDNSVAPVTLSMTPFQVPAGAEVYYCQNFANPWGGKQVDIKVYSLQMGVGSHHMFAFYASDATNGTNAPCISGGLTFGAFTFVSQSPKKTVDFPQSVGATIPASTGFQLMVHYLNTTASTITGSVNLTMYIAKSGAVTQHAGVLFLNNSTMTVAPTCTSGCPSTQSYPLGQDIYVLSTEGHMHKYGTNFLTTVSPSAGLPNGQLYQTTVWNEPQQQSFSPPVKLAAGTTVTWTCTDVNTTGETLTFGESAATNVMCISQSIIYPVTDVDNPVLGSSVGGL